MEYSSMTGLTGAIGLIVCNARSSLRKLEEDLV
jgi:hypothetical protein